MTQKGTHVFNISELVNQTKWLTQWTCDHSGPSGEADSIWNQKSHDHSEKRHRSSACRAVVGGSRHCEDRDEDGQAQDLPGEVPGRQEESGEGAQDTALTTQLDTAEHSPSGSGQSLHVSWVQRSGQHGHLLPPWTLQRTDTPLTESDGLTYFPSLG